MQNESRNTPNSLLPNIVVNDQNLTIKTELTHPSTVKIEKKKSVIPDRTDLHIREMEHSLRLNRIPTTFYGKSQESTETPRKDPNAESLLDIVPTSFTNFEAAVIELPQN